MLGFTNTRVQFMVQAGGEDLWDAGQTALDIIQANQQQAKQATDFQTAALVIGIVACTVYFIFIFRPYYRRMLVVSRGHSLAANGGSCPLWGAMRAETCEWITPLRPGPWLQERENVARALCELPARVDLDGLVQQVVQARTQAEEAEERKLASGAIGFSCTFLGAFFGLSTDPCCPL